MTSLIARLEQAQGGDRELDAEIAAAIEPYRFDAPGFDVVRPIPPFRLDAERTAIRFEGGGIMCISYFPKYTTSVDAALSLAERVLPGWTGFLDFGGSGKVFVADIMSEARAKQTGEDEEENGIDPSQEAHGEGASPSIALCIAILRAHGGSK